MSRADRRHDEVPWASFSDALSGMLFIFVITTFWFALRLAAATQAAEETTRRLEGDIRTLRGAQEASQDLIQTPGGALGRFAACLDESDHLSAEPDRESSRVSLYLESPDAGTAVRWFEPCEATLGGPQSEAARDVRGCVRRVLHEEGSRYDVRVFLEGHTDAVAVTSCGSGLISNWELSGARAAAVTRAVLTPQAGSASSDDIRRAVEAQRLQLLAVGLAETRPAWASICARPDRLSDLDEEVCAALRAADPAGTASALDAPGARGCVVPASSDTCAGASLSARLCRWANGCADRDGSVEGRRALLRRVDLRIELVPRLGDDPSGRP